MEFTATEFEGVYIIKNNFFQDDRRRFMKIFNKEVFSKNGIDITFEETYYSVSKKNVIRGMHFQLPPDAHAKLVCVAKGAILDVVLDLRSNSKTFGKAFSVELTDNNGKMIFIPKGFAHGFKSLEQDTIMINNVSTIYSPQNDYGVSWDSFGFD